MADREEGALLYLGTPTPEAGFLKRAEPNQIEWRADYRGLWRPDRYLVCRCSAKIGLRPPAEGSILGAELSQLPVHNSRPLVDCPAGSRSKLSRMLEDSSMPFSRQYPMFLLPVCRSIDWCGRLEQLCLILCLGSVYAFLHYAENECSSWFLYKQVQVVNRSP